MPNLCKKIIVIHYSEIALKGRNRSYFENKLKTNIKKALYEVKIKEIERPRPGFKRYVFFTVVHLDAIDPYSMHTFGMADHA